MEMQQHLDEGCGVCAQTSNLWNRVLEVAGREPSFEAPNGAVRCANALFAAFPPLEGGKRSLRIARLFGLEQPALEGVRGAVAAHSHFLFQEGNLLLDMQLESRTSSLGDRSLTVAALSDTSVSIAGQVFDSRANQGLAGANVAVMRGGDELARTTTNSFGEFQLEYEAESDLLLVISLENESYLVSRLPAPPEV